MSPSSARRGRFSFHHATVLAVVAVLFIGCDRGTSESGDNVSQNGSAPDGRNLPPIPMLACSRTVRGTATLETVAEAQPDLGNSVAGRNGWVAMQVTDAAVGESGELLVLDRSGPTILAATSELEPQQSWGSKGGGPGEMQRPVAVARAGNVIAVLESTPPRLILFDADGTYRKEKRLEESAADIAIDGRGRIIIARDVMPPAVRSVRGAYPVLLAYDPAHDRIDPLVQVRAADLTPPRFVLPGPNRVLVAARDHRIAVFYPAAGVVDVYDDGDLAFTSQICVPDEVSKAYTQQYTLAAQTMSQGWIPQISDVLLASDGGLYTISPIRTEHGEYLIHSFGPEGVDAGSWLVESGGVVLPAKLSFQRDPARVLGFWSDGRTGLFRVNGLAP